MFGDPLRDMSDSDIELVFDAKDVALDPRPVSPEGDRYPVDALDGLAMASDATVVDGSAYCGNGVTCCGW